MELTPEVAAFEARAMQRAREIGLDDKPGAYVRWRRQLRRDYDAALASPGKIVATFLATGMLFFLVDPDALLGVTMCNRPMTAEEQRQYSAHPMCQRRRKPGESVDDDEERERRKRVVALMQGIHGDQR